MTVLVEPRAAVGDLTIIVFGSPAPQGSKAFKGFSGAGRAILVEQVKSVRPWREDVRAASLAVTNLIPGWVPLDGPLVAEMVFTLRKPASAPKRRRTWPDRTPDLSKLLRSTEDALTSAGAWRDDARVVEYRRLAKVYPGEDRDALSAPGAVIRVWRMAGAV